MKYLCFYVLAVFQLQGFVHTVDLSLEPQERWRGVAEHYSEEELETYAACINDMIEEAGAPVSWNWVRRKVLASGLAESDEPDLEPWLAELRGELKGLALALKERMGGVELVGFREQDLFLLNVGYDFSAYCTTGVYQSDEGPVLYRNLDWDDVGLRPFAMEVEFVKEGRVLYRSLHFLGQIGVLTAVKPGQFAVALNYRKTPGTGCSGWAEFKGIIANGWQYLWYDAWSSALLLRHTMEHQTTFAAAKTTLEEERLMAPCYLTIAGCEPGEGAVLERGRDECHTRTFANEHPCYLVQTNHDVPRPADQDEEWAGNDELLSEKMGMGTSTRRAKALLVLAGLSGPQELLWMLTDVSPIFNEQTLFSAVMTPRSGELTWVHHTE